MSLAIKKQILKEVRNSGLAGALDDDALDCITDFLKQQGNAEQLQPLLKSCQRGMQPVSCMRNNQPCIQPHLPVKMLRSAHRM
jgi:hypothetical protein